MRTTPALTFLAAFLASSAVGVLASPQAGLGHAPAKACNAAKHHQRHKHQGEDAPAPAPAPGFSGDFAAPAPGVAGSSAAPAPQVAHAPQGAPAPQVAEFAAPSSDKKMQKRKGKKGSCAVKPKDQKAGKSQDAAASQKGGAAGAAVFGDEGAGYQAPDGASSPGSAPEGYSNTSQPGDKSSDRANPGSAQDGYAPFTPEGNAPSAPKGIAPSSRYSPSPDNGSNPPPGKVDADGVHCKGVLGSTRLTPTAGLNPTWFSPSLIHHGPGTEFGGGDNFWQGGACMFDSLPHANLPSVAIDQTFFQHGLACGTCVEIAPTSASLFSNSAHWSVESPHIGKLPAGKSTIAIVSDLCPGVEQCWSGLDMHPDTWKSVTGGAGGSKLPISWKFVNCKEAFEKSASKGLQVHWREGANPGFFEVQVRGSHEAVVRVEMKVKGKGWQVAKHVDSSWWQWDHEATQGVDEKTEVVFRVTDWQGQTITSEVGTSMGKDLFFQANFDKVEGGSQEGY